MGKDLCSAYPAARKWFDRAGEVLGFDLASVCFEGPEDELRETRNTQPALYVKSWAAWSAASDVLTADFVAGHSLGEYSALVAAGALGLGDAACLVRRRGALMQQAVPEGEGGMTAVLGLSGEEVARVCASIEGAVAPANFNSPVQTVVAGEREALAAATAALEAAGAAKLIPLPVSAPFHSPLMTPAQEKLAPALAETCFWNARVPVISNVTAQAYTSVEDARDLLRQQVCAPVRWLDCVQTLVRAGVRVQLEVGPGRVLSGLARKIERGLVCANVEKPGDLEGALARVEEALA
jgi:[acyl-carrier-protein] S-malonyltransferase